MLRLEQLEYALNHDDDDRVDMPPPSGSLLPRFHGSTPTTGAFVEIWLLEDKWFAKALIFGLGKSVQMYLYFSPKKRTKFLLKLNIPEDLKYPNIHEDTSIILER